MSKGGEAPAGSAEARCIVGFMPSAAPPMQLTMDLAYGARCDFVAMTLMHGRRMPDDEDVDGPLTRADRSLPSDRWATEVVGCVSTWIAPDSDHTELRQAAQRALVREISWAQHLSLPAIILPPPEHRCLNYARIICTIMLKSVHPPNLWLRVPLVYPGGAAGASADAGMDVADAALTTARGEAVLYAGDTSVVVGSSGSVRARDPWAAWNRLRLATEHCPRISVALEVTPELPDEDALSRWFAEPIRAIIIQTSTFLTNAKGFPVLPKGHQTFIRRMIRAFNPRLIVEGSPLHGTPGVVASAGAPKANGGETDESAALAYYIQYVHHLHRTIEPLTTQESFEKNYRDYLQAPLQPLFDNLESQTYETFEKDPIKYLKYEYAVRDALLANPTFSTVMVVGAGRGPLVAATLRASATVGRPLTVFAVEKNPNAVITLRNRVRDDAGWSGVVTVVDSDMRFWEAPDGVKADILVSELLGSFGDNELSPECLDGAQRFLRSDGGISIPADYTSFVAPVASPKLWQQINGLEERNKLETPYVVRLWNFVQLAPAQPCFKFTHPRLTATLGAGAPGTEGEYVDNRRFGTVHFATQAVSSMVHGFAGFFESTLFGEQVRMWRGRGGARAWGSEEGSALVASSLHSLYCIVLTHIHPPVSLPLSLSLLLSSLHADDLHTPPDALARNVLVVSALFSAPHTDLRRRGRVDRISHLALCGRAWREGVVRMVRRDGDVHLAHPQPLRSCLRYWPLKDAIVMPISLAPAT